MLLMAIFAVEPIRRKHFELFYYMHMLAFPVQENHMQQVIVRVTPFSGALVLSIACYRHIRSNSASACSVCVRLGCQVIVRLFESASALTKFAGFCCGLELQL